MRKPWKKNGPGICLLEPNGWSPMETAWLCQLPMDGIEMEEGRKKWQLCKSAAKWQSDILIVMERGWCPRRLLCFKRVLWRIQHRQNRDAGLPWTVNEWHSKFQSKKFVVIGEKFDHTKDISGPKLRCVVGNWTRMHSMKFEMVGVHREDNGGTLWVAYILIKCETLNEGLLLTTCVQSQGSNDKSRWCTTIDSLTKATTAENHRKVPAPGQKHGWHCDACTQ